MKYHLYWISILCFIMCLLGCNKRQIIWTDLMQDSSQVDIKLLFTKEFYQSKKVSLSPNNTRYIYVPNFYSCTGQEHISDICMYIYPRKFTNKVKATEIFIFDAQNVIEFDTYFKVDKKDNVLAFFIDFCDRTGKNYTILSKDNILDKVYIADKNTKNIEQILQILETCDYAYYTGTFFSIEPHLIPHNGYIVKSKVDGSYIWLSTYTHQF